LLISKSNFYLVLAGDLSNLQIRNWAKAVCEGKWDSMSTPPSFALLTGVPTGSRFAEQAEQARACAKKVPNGASSSEKLPAPHQSVTDPVVKPDTHSSSSSSPVMIRIKFLPRPAELFQPRMLVRSSASSFRTIRIDLAAQINQPVEDIAFEFDGAVVDLDTAVGLLVDGGDRKLDVNVCLNLISLKVQIRSSDGSVDTPEVLLPFSRAHPVTYRHILKALPHQGQFKVLVDDALVEELNDVVFDLNEVVVVQRQD
jgi:hypothetical protein